MQFKHWQHCLARGKHSTDLHSVTLTKSASRKAFRHFMGESRSETGNVKFTVKLVEGSAVKARIF